MQEADPIILEFGTEVLKVTDVMERTYGGDSGGGDVEVGDVGDGGCEGERRT